MTIGLSKHSRAYLLMILILFIPTDYSFGKSGSQVNHQTRHEYTYQIPGKIVELQSFNNGNDGNPRMLTGILKQPEGVGPFPALVLLHGSGGIKARRDVDWSERLINWGYVTLQVDSFGPRGESTKTILANSRRVPPDNRAGDAHAARRYLSGLPYVDGERIAVIGWSHGGLPAILSVHSSYGEDSFKAAIAFYPYCSYSMNDLKAPLLILIGEADDWCPASNCSYMMPSGKTEHEIILKIYPGVYHDFDWRGVNKIVKGHRVLYDGNAEADAIARVENFLAKHLN